MLRTLFVNFIRTVLLTAVAVGFALVAPLPAGAGGDRCHNAPPQAEGTGTEVSMQYNCFAPTVLRTEVDATVHFRNFDAQAHEVAGVASTWGSSQAMATGTVTDATFQKSGIYPYSCRLHIGMTGVVVVGDGSAARLPTGDGETVLAFQRVDADDSAPAAIPQQAASTADDEGAVSLPMVIAVAVIALLGATSVTLALSRKRAA